MSPTLPRALPRVLSLMLSLTAFLLLVACGPSDSAPPGEAATAAPSENPSQTSAASQTPPSASADALIADIEASLATFERDTAVILRGSGPSIHIQVYSDDSGYRKVMIREDREFGGSRATAYFDREGRFRTTEATEVGTGREPMTAEEIKAFVERVFGPRG